MNPQDSNKKNPQDSKELMEKRNIGKAIEQHSGEEKNDKSLNASYTEFVNSGTIPEAMIRAAENVPEGLIKSLAWKYVKTINSILSKTLFYLGIELGSSNDDIVAKAKEATDKVLLLTRILVKVLDHPEVKENVVELAKDLNNAVLKPFLKVALITVDEMSPQIDLASEKLKDRVHSGIRKLTDAAGNGVLSGLGTVPYVGNILNATELLANTALGVQGIVDESVGAILDQSLQTLIILQKVGGPGVGALDSWINFVINANNAMTNFKNQYDKISSTMNTQKFNPDPLKSRDVLEEKARAKIASQNTPTVAPVDEVVVDKKAPIVKATPVVKASANPQSAPTKPIKGGRKKRRKNTRKRNHKKRTKKYRKKSRKRRRK
jgi:hypothetical protein